MVSTVGETGIWYDVICLHDPRLISSIIDKSFLLPLRMGAYCSFTDDNMLVMLFCSNGLGWLLTANQDHSLYVCSVWTWYVFDRWEST